MIVVIPTCRRIDLNNLAPLIDNGARFIVIDDTEGTVRIDHPQFRVLNWDDRRHLLGRLDYAVPRRNGAARSLGFLLAWREADADELIIALDDDCLVESEDFVNQVNSIFREGVGHRAISKGDCLNILELYANVDGSRVFPRGFPYSSRPDYQPFELSSGRKERVVFNLGLWSGILDVNAFDKLFLPSWAVDEAVLRVPNVVLPADALVSLCSMNMQFRREVVPAIYQLPMHIEIMPDLVIDRYGDIWGGFVLQVLAGRRGDLISVGEPTIKHLKEGGFERNLWQEQGGHLVNDEFIDVLRACGSRIAPAAYLEMVRSLSYELAEETERRSPILKRYFEHLTNSLKGWVALLELS